MNDFPKESGQCDYGSQAQTASWARFCLPFLFVIGCNHEVGCLWTESTCS